MRYPHRALCAPVMWECELESLSRKEVQKWLTRKDLGGGIRKTE